MSSSAQSMSENQTERPAVLQPTQPFAWSVRREVWEHRAIWIAPLVAAGLVLFGFGYRLFKLPELMRAVARLSPMARDAALAAPFAIAAGAILVTGLIVSVFYCLGTLNNERRDRSILFWKSLPVSDLTTVLAKAFVPFVVLPVVVFAVAIATQLIMLLLGSAALMATGNNAAILWTHWPMGRMTLVLLYFVVINTLWYAPVFGWLLMISSWARRMAFLWAVLPWLGLVIVERIALDTAHVWSFLGYRLNGAVSEGFDVPPSMHKSMPVIDPLALLAPGHFLSTPGLWLGLVAAGVFIAAAIWFRRMREPG